MSWPLGRYVERAGSGTATFTSIGGLQGPQLAADAAAEARERYLIAGPFSTHTPLTPVAVAGDVTYAFDPEAIRFEPSRILTEDTYIAFEGATAYGERSKIPFRVDQPQLAGERSLPGRHHDGVRRADPRDPDRRRRQVRRRHAGRVPPSAHRGPLHRLRDARLGRQLGRRSTATSSSRTPTRTSAAP